MEGHNYQKKFKGLDSNHLTAVPALVTSANLALLLLDQFPSLPSQYQHRAALALLSTLSLGEDEHSLGPSLVEQAVIRRRLS